MREVRFSDQFKNDVSYLFLRESVTIFLVSYREGSDWVNLVVERFGDQVVFQRVASLSGRPRFAPFIVRSFLKRLTIHPVTLGWKRVFPKPV